jgi:hypothetical protein
MKIDNLVKEVIELCLLKISLLTQGNFDFFIETNF